MASDLPDHFKCPISLEIMSDPVILSSGHTFERSSIQRWLEQGHRTCPITKLPLPDHPDLIPNHALRSLISTFTTTTLSPQTPHHQTLISTLTSPSSTPDSKSHSLRHLSRLSSRDSSLRRRLSDSAAPAALSCLTHPSLQEPALSLLLTLSLDDDTKVGLLAQGALPRLLPLLLSPASSPSSRAVAATLITSLALVEVNNATIGAYPGAIAALVSLLLHGHARERKEAATALYAVCSFPDNRRRAVECGAVPILLRNVDSGLERGVEVLGVLAKCKEGRVQMEGCDGCVRILARVLRDGSSRGVQYALLALNSLCSNSEVMVLDALEEGVLEICVGLMEDESEKVRRNSSSLIRLLRGNQWDS